MEIRIFKTAEEIGVEAAKIFTDTVKSNPNAVLGLATGASPIPTYKNIIKTYNEGGISFKDVKTYNLDEYCDLPKNDKNSYYTFMHEQLFNSLDIKEENVHFLNGNAEDTEKECARYDAEINNAGGIDVQLLGIGNNAHIGFNEPDENLIAVTHKTGLTESTIEANARFFESKDQVPTMALTMGIASILKSKKIVLLANGKAKHNAVKALLNDEITTNNPATMLKVHPDVVLICDKAAYSGE